MGAVALAQPTCTVLLKLRFSSLRKIMTIPTRIIQPSVSSDLDQAIAALRDSKPVAIPTETVYGLAANALDSLACSRIFSVKNRPTDNPLICHISSMDQLATLCSRVPDSAQAVMERFWPGPLTLLLPKSEAVPDIVSAGLPTVGVRFPSHPVAREIISACGFPLAAPSANLSGRPSPTTAKHVLDDLNGRIEFIVDGGSSSFGLESTVLDITNSPPTILRPGAITAAMLRPFLPDVRVYGLDTVRSRSLEERPSTPGMKYKHYAPTAPVILVRPGPDLEARVSSYLRDHPPKTRVVRLCTRKTTTDPSVLIMYMSTCGDLEEIARNLFACLREADLLTPDYILAEAVDETAEEDEAAQAIMNRLGKAASHHI